FDTQAFLKCVVALLAMVNPLAAIPLFLGLTHQQTPAQRRRTASISTLAVFVTLLLMAAVGQSLLDFFGITLPAFKVAGGLIIILIAFSMLHARPSSLKHTKDEAAEAVGKEVAIVPLAIPFLAGPGAISIVIVTTHHLGGLIGFTTVGCAVVLLVVLLWVTLRFAVPVGAFLGQTGMNVITRLMGILLAAI